MAKNNNATMEERIRLLTEELADMAKIMGVNLNKGYTPDGIKRVNMNAYIDERIINKLRFAIYKGYLPSLVALEVPLKEFVDILEEKHGPLDDTPLKVRLGHNLNTKSSTPAQRLMRQMNRQIIKLKEEFCK